MKRRIFVILRWALLLYLLYCHPHSGSEYQRKENNDAEYRKQNLVFQ